MGTLRHQRGYNFEKHVVDWFNSKPKDMGWHARILGGSSTGLPDVVVTNTRMSVIMSMECKSSASNYAYIPNDQLLRCQGIIEMFSVFKYKAIVFAFKFTRSAKTPKGEKYNRKLKYYFFAINRIEGIENIENVRCEYETGKLSILRNDPKIPVMADYKDYERLDELQHFLHY